jgi:NADH-quinone oxidoreductase subunit N
MAGIPPLAGFFAKYYVLVDLFQSGLDVPVVVALATSLVSTYYYLRIVKTLLFEGGLKLVKRACTLEATLTTGLLMFAICGFILYGPLMIDSGFFDKLTGLLIYVDVTAP